MDKLGIDAIQLAAQFVNVGILLVVLRKFLYKPVLQLLDQRRAQIVQNQDMAASLEKKLKTLEEKEREIHRKGKQSAEALVENAKKEIKEIRGQYLEDARKDARAIIDKARTEAARELEIERLNLHARVAEQAADLANDALGKFLDEKTRMKLTVAQIESVQKKGRNE